MVRKTISRIPFWWRVEFRTNDEQCRRHQRQHQHQYSVAYSYVSDLKYFALAAKFMHDHDFSLSNRFTCEHENTALR